MNTQKIINLTISISLILVMIASITFVIWVIGNELTASGEVVDCLNCNPDILSHWSFLNSGLPILIILVSISALLFLINRVRPEPIPDEDSTYCECGNKLTTETEKLNKICNDCK